MKHLLTLALVLCLGTFASAQIPSYVPTNGLVGWWPFNGNANDESGNGINLTNNGAVLTTDRFNLRNSALQFNGIQSAAQYLITNQITSFNSTSYSISCWIFLDQYNPPQVGGNPYNYNDFQFQGIASINNSNNWNIGPGLSLGLDIQNNSKLTTGHWTSTGTGNGWVSNDSLIKKNTWYYLCTTFKNNLLNVFLNGILIDSINTQLSFLNQHDFIIGGQRNGSNMNVMGGFKGKIDDVLFYNRALSAAEVQQLYQGNSSNTPAASTVPGKIHYQGLAVGTNGKPIKNGTLGLRLSVLDSQPNGSNLYTETQTASTDAAGIFSTYLGGGTAIAGTFANIPWANGNDKFLKVEMDAQGGTNYQNMGSTQLVSVPYALAAGSLREGALLYGNNGQKYQITIDSSGPKWILVPPAVAPFACGQSVTYAGESYPTVQIGTQCWFQKNLNVGVMVNSPASIDSQRNNGILEKYCYNNDTANCTIYGGLYQWAEAVQYQNGASNTTSPSPAFTGNVKGICPTGWHVPSDGEWCALTTFLDATASCSNGTNSTTAGGMLKSTSGLWNSPNTGATNSSGFSALPAGFRETPFGFREMGDCTDYWSISENFSFLAFQRNLRRSLSSSRRFNGDKSNGYSVRCLKD